VAPRVQQAVYPAGGRMEIVDGHTVSIMKRVFWVTAVFGAADEDPAKTTVLGRRGKGYNRQAYRLTFIVRWAKSSCVSCGECMVSCPTVRDE